MLLHRLNDADAQPIVVFEPGVDTDRTLRVSVSTPSGDACAALTALSFDVVAMR